MVTQQTRPYTASASYAAKSTDSGPRQAGFTPVLHLPGLLTLGKSLFLGLRFLICKRGMTIVSTSCGCDKDKMSYT